MAEISHSIDLSLPEKLKDREYRHDFFWAQAGAEIAEGLVRLRKRRNMNQKDVAKATGTQQPAISRAEQADYDNWNLRTLRTIATALDARIRVLIQPSEDVLSEYDGRDVSEPVERAAGAIVNSMTVYEFPVSHTPTIIGSPFASPTWFGGGIGRAAVAIPNAFAYAGGFGGVSVGLAEAWTPAPRLPNLDTLRTLDAFQRENKKLQNENDRLRAENLALRLRPATRTQRIELTSEEVETPQRMPAGVITANWNTMAGVTTR